jgi:mRNA-degrading endonuclease RelE of RelBE toxin-antitoxin system
MLSVSNWGSKLETSFSFKWRATQEFSAMPEPKIPSTSSQSTQSASTERAEQEDSGTSQKKKVSTSTVSNRYEVDLTRHAEKDLKALRAWNAAIFRHLARLETNPEAGHLLKGALHGCRSLELNLKGSGAYRAVYVIAPGERVCTVFLIGPHENIYREAERRVQALRKSGEIPDPD